MALTRGCEAREAGTTLEFHLFENCLIMNITKLMMKYTLNNTDCVK